MATVEELAIKLEHVDQRIEKVEDKQDHIEQLVSSVAVLATEQKQLKSDVTEIKSDVKALTEKPAKRLDGIVDKIIGLLIAGLGGFLLAQIGM